MSRTKGRYKADRHNAKLGFQIKSISMTASEWRELDYFAERAQMSRSAWMRQASKHFAAKVFPDG